MDWYISECRWVCVCDKIAGISRYDKTSFWSSKQGSGIQVHATRKCHRSRWSMRVIDTTQLEKTMCQGKDRSKNDCLYSCECNIEWKRGSVVFPDLNCNAYISYAFYSENDETFHQWCMDYFNYLWGESNEFDERMVRER